MSSLSETPTIHQMIDLIRESIPDTWLPGLVLLCSVEPHSHRKWNSESGQGQRELSNREIAVATGISDPTIRRAQNRRLLVWRYKAGRRVSPEESVHEWHLAGCPTR
jgi:hypothetical protein